MFACWGCSGEFVSVVWCATQEVGLRKLHLRGLLLVFACLDSGNDSVAVTWDAAGRVGLSKKGLIFPQRTFRFRYMGRRGTGRAGKG